MRYHQFFFLSFLLLLASCQVRSVEKKDVLVVFNLDRISKEDGISNEYVDLQFIRLDCAREGLLSSADKLIVTDRGYYVLNNGEYPTVNLFNADGSFACKVGSFGRSKGEYTNIMDIAANEKGDTVVIMTLTDFKQYDSFGKFLFSSPIEEDQRWECVVNVPMGYACCRNYRGTEYLAALYDKKFSSKHDLIQTSNELVTGEAPFATNQLQCDGKYLCYWDMFNSEFYVSVLGCSDSTRRYSLCSDKMISLDTIEEKGRDYVSSYILNNGKIRGRMVYHGESIGFEIDLGADTFSFCDAGGLFLSFKDYHKGYYYSIVKPSDLLFFMNDEYTFVTKHTPSVEALRKAFSRYRDELSELDNYYLLKMRVKEYGE